MHLRFPKLALALLAAFAPIALARAADPVAAPDAKGSAITLKVGDPAPKLQTGKWVQGESVKALDRDHAYLLEFWATWCGPCKAAIPHVNDLYRKFQDKGFVVIGQNVWETSEAAVEPFVKKMADKMTYRVALDDKADGGKGRMAETWLAAAGKNGIPASFLVDKQGIVVWIGHPMDLQESMVEEVLAGKFDAKKAAAAQPDRAAIQARTSTLSRGIGEAIAAKDWAKAERLIAELETALPGSQKFVAGTSRIGLLLARGEPEAAAKLAEKLAGENQANPLAQTMIAASLARAKDAQPVALDTAERILTRANEAADGKDLLSLMALARIAFLKGDQAKAVELQTKVVDLAPAAGKARLRQYLDDYKAGKLPDATAARTLRPATAAPASDKPVSPPADPPAAAK